MPATRTRGRRATEFRNEMRALWQPLNAACGICGQATIDYEAPPFTSDALELDHIKAFSKHPELEFDPTNVRPSHFRCNRGRSNRDAPPDLGTTSEPW